MFRLTRYGCRECVLATILAGGSAAGAWWFLGPAHWAFWPVAVVLGGGWLWVMAFFRDPDRRVPGEEGLFVSPADGRVSDIAHVGPDSVLGRRGLRIGIFMNVFDVHVNRSPCAGRVERIDYRRGRFLDARDPHASERNESATIRIAYARNDRTFEVIVRQIAGLVARRIVTDLSEGQTILPGQRIGMIKLGSRLELLVPEELVGELRVHVGDRVRAGETVLIVASRERA